MIAARDAPVPWTEGHDFIATKLVLTCGNDLLVCLRDDFDHIPYPAHWDLPGGGREGAETAADCALRELEEEFGLILSADRLPARMAFLNPTGRGRASVFYIGQITPADIASIRFGDEGQCWRMMPVADYLTHPRAVPHFPVRVAQCLGLTDAG